MNLNTVLYSLHLNLMHEGSGGYRTFNNAIERVGVKNYFKNKKFTSYAFLQALAMSDFLRVTHRANGLFWAVNPDLYSSKLPETGVLFGDYFLKNSSKDAKVLYEEKAIIFCENHADKPQLRDGMNLNVYSPFKYVVDNFTIRVNSLSDTDNEDRECYCFERLGWYSEERSKCNSNLFRIKSSFMGFAYYIYSKESNVFFRVTNSEWSYLIACYLLNIDLNRIFRREGDSIAVHSSIKIPGAIMQYLFTNSTQVYLGNNYHFSDVNDEAEYNLQSYLLVG